MKSASITILAFAFSLLLAACGRDGRTGATPINAAEGGTVTTSTHDILIPPSALPADTVVTLSMADTSGYPEIAGERSVVLRVEPEGTVLEIPATVTIHADRVGVTAEDRVALYQLSDGVWSPLEFRYDVETREITTSISFFTPIGVGITAPVAGGGVIQGRISWGDATPVVDAPIELYQGTTLIQSTTSDAEGAYRFEGLESGTYNIRVNYECMIDLGVGVASGMTVTQDLTLCG